MAVWISRALSICAIVIDHDNVSLAYQAFNRIWCLKAEIRKRHAYLMDEMVISMMSILVSRSPVKCIGYRVREDGLAPLHFFLALLENTESSDSRRPLQGEDSCHLSLRKSKSYATAGSSQRHTDERICAGMYGNDEHN